MALAHDVFIFGTSDPWLTPRESVFGCRQVKGRSTSLCRVPHGCSTPGLRTLSLGQFDQGQEAKLLQDEIRSGGNSCYGGVGDGDFEPPIYDEELDVVTT